MPDRVRRVADRLQSTRQAAERLIVEVPWITAFTAFTAPGRYIYFSRRLLERCPTDEAAAFVIAHEIAHHDLGHLQLFTGPFARHAARLGPAALVIVFFRMLQKRVYKLDWELAADRRAIDLCLAAGYKPAKCLKLFDVLERWLLDYGDLTGVYGLDPESDQELSTDASVMTKARIWLWQRERGYLPIQDRVAVLKQHLRDVQGRHDKA
jgi:predicted Zn-dependent protease